MSRRILNAHTGECLFADFDSFEALDDLRRWIAGNADISEKRQVLLTRRGKQVKLQTLRTEDDIFVYDRELIQGSSEDISGLASALEQLRFPQPVQVPGQPSDLGNLQAWLNTAQARSEWSLHMEESCHEAIDLGRRLASEVAIVQQGTAIAVENLKQHLSSLQQRHHQAKDWVESLLAAQASFEQERGTLESRFSAVPTAGQLHRFLKKSASQTNAKTLLELLGGSNLDDLSARATKVSSKLQSTVDKIGASFAEASEKGTSIIQNFSQDFVSSTGDLLETLDSHANEQAVLCKKIYDDCVAACRSENGDSNQIAKIFSRHDKNLIPPLLETFADIQDTVSKISERRQQLVTSAIGYMQNISGAESLIGQISQGFGRLELNANDDATLESLDSIYRLPFVYGSLLIEVVRRREWTEKMTTDSTSLAEEMATYRDEEERRRKKWYKSVSHFIGDELNGDVMGIDVSLRSASEKLPALSRDLVTSYVEALRKAGGFDEIVSELTTMLKAIDVPSKQQTRRANAFRSGSVSDSPFGRNSLLLRGDDELIRSLQSDKARLEERLKGSDSRVRRLEDLLHRQSQISSRPSSRGAGAGFPYDRQVTTPTTIDGFSKMPIQPQSPGPYGSRRSSLVAQLQEHNPLTDRLAHLEAELASEKARAAKLEEAAVKNQQDEEALKTEIHDTKSMNKDLLDNFQARQNEFEDERRILEDENRKLKDQLEELENDYDRIAGSHNNTQLEELKHLRERAADEVSRITAESDKIRKEKEDLGRELEAARQERDEKSKLKTQAEARTKELEVSLQERDKSQAEHFKTLRSAHKQMANGDAPPMELGSLVAAVDRLSGKAASHLQDVQQALDKARTETVAQSKQIEARVAENSQLRSRFEQQELEVFSLRDEVADRKARYASLETELDDQRQDLESMRTKCTQNESIVQTLRERLRAEERKSLDLNTNLSSTKTRHTQAENHLSRLNERISILEDVRDRQASQLETRASRAEEITVRLDKQNKQLLRLLSQVGFTATRQAGGYNFERTSRLANGSSTLIESTSPVLSRTTTRDQEEEKPSYLKWASSEDANVEKDFFEQFLQEVDALRPETVFETLVKRFKDVEHTARKWQREAKNYRERFHKTQFEAQNKIAFRSFKEGDLALFLPTRNQAPKRSWAAFNVGAPHYFLREQEHHTLKSRDWLVARISRAEERVVDLSKGMGSDIAMGSSNKEGGANDDAASTMTEDDNPFGLSDGLRWYYLDASEERLGAAPTTPGLGKSTVASAPEHATGSSVPTNKKKPGEVNAAAKVLTKSLDSRRSSTNSKKSTAGAMASPANATGTFDTGHAEGGAAAAAVAASAVVAGGTASDRSSMRRPGSRESMAQSQLQAQQQQQQQQQGHSPQPQQHQNQQASTQQDGRREQGWSSLWSMDVSLESGRKDAPGR